MNILNNFFIKQVLLYLYFKNRSMQVNFNPKLSEKLYLKNPEQSALGKQIIQKSIKLIFEMGYEQFTFKKLAIEVPTTEATVYRYFENKHKLLIYLIDWYWAYISFQVIFHLNNVNDPKQKIKKLIDLLVWEDNVADFETELDQKALYYICIAEGNKTYFSKDVDEHNKERFYKPYKDLIELIAGIFKEYNPDFAYSRSLASTLVEASHFQYYFMQHLPRLCDFTEHKNPKEIEVFLENMVFGTLDSDYALVKMTK